MEMRRRIQETALDLFDREGFENVSVEEIAQPPAAPWAISITTSKARTNWPSS